MFVICFLKFTFTSSVGAPQTGWEYVKNWEMDEGIVVFCLLVGFGDNKKNIQNASLIL